MNTTRDTIVVAGSTGFVGAALGEAIGAEHHLVGLTRDAAKSPKNTAYAGFRGCDLYSLLDAERALVGARVAVYLVHSMMPAARLTQGSFRDMDLICADNFARAARKAGVEQIVYLGGLLPEGVKLSAHLESRLEVERTLGAHGVPVTTLRAGLILGRGGSSFLMMARLVRRLPVMVSPRWAESPTQPIALADIVALLRFTIGNEATYGETFDVGGPEVMTYRSMMKRTSEILGLERRILPLPIIPRSLSRLWVSVITGAPRELVSPLIESLGHPMVARDHALMDRAGITATSFDDAVREALADPPRGATPVPASPREIVPVAYQAAPDRASGRRSDVRSVQRLPLPPGHDAAWVASEYLRWLPEGFRPFVRVEVDGPTCRFYSLGLATPLLVLELSPLRSGKDRQLFYITGGLLASGKGRGRLEFREVLDRRFVIAAIHEFEPTLPWYVYRLSQAYAHLWVMWRFRRHLARVIAEEA
ncbi:MAG: NAD-dependent epimerase/dehydratase family protein [Byssovorax sp.]